jgi:ribosome-binding protein aMBF1 (putative translation factor)
MSVRLASTSSECYPDSGDPESAALLTVAVAGTEKGKTPRQAEFGDRVRSSRQQRGFSQESLAHRAGINRTYIATLEAGRRNPSLDLMARLASALDVDLADLVRGLQAVRGRTGA